MTVYEIHSNPMTFVSDLNLGPHPGLAGILPKRHIPSSSLAYLGLQWEHILNLRLDY